ncbi:uncharacterized protein [Penaeus vannamei]|uniref:uncharacterized protein isoform X3 n=1 Tax=Penaeus vannamei TaxID=6689 RepID=UPI00387F3AC8
MDKRLFLLCIVLSMTALAASQTCVGLRCRPFPPITKPPIDPPVDPPVGPPVEPPVEPTVEPPVEPTCPPCPPCFSPFFLGDERQEKPKGAE